MRFEHLVEINGPATPGTPASINDPLHPASRLLTRHELWRGLVVRAERPMLFLPHLSHATILARTPTGLVRVLQFGATHVTDEVWFEEQREVRYEIAPQGEIPRSRLRMTIEEPQPGRLFVRFLYEDEGTERDETIDALREAAYEAADLDTIATIRWLVEHGELDRVSTESLAEGAALPD